MEHISKEKEAKGKKSPKKYILIGVVVFVLLLIVGFIIARPEILEGNFDLDYLLFRTEDVALERVEEDTVEERIQEDGEPVLVWTVEHENRIQSLAISPDGETVAVGEYLTSYIYHLADGELEQVTVYRHSVEDLEFSPDGNVLAGGLTVYGVLLTDPHDGSEILDLHGGYNGRVSFSPNGEVIATANRGGIVWIWDLETGDQLKELEEAETTMANAIEYHPDGNMIGVTHSGRPGSNGYVNIWDLESEEIVERFDLNINIGLTKNIFRYSPTGEVMALFDGDEERNYWVYLLDVETGEELRKIEVGGWNFRDIDFSPDGEMIALARQTEAVSIWDVETGELIYTFDQEGMVSGISNWISAVSFTPDGKHVAVLRGDNSLELWRLPGGQTIEPRPRDISNPPPLPSDVLFDANEAVLKASANEELEDFAGELYAEFKEARITFIGHTTSYAEEDFNLELSTNRANAVKEWFENWASENSVDGWQLFAEGKGSTELRVPDFDSEGNFLESAGALNRRVEIEIEVE